MNKLNIVSDELAYILNLRNTAIDHKENCSNNCNVSVYELRRTAQYIAKYITDSEQSIAASKLIEEMPIG